MFVYCTVVIVEFLKAGEQSLLVLYDGPQILPGSENTL
jgi:hypothetical protein